MIKNFVFIFICNPVNPLTNTFSSVVDQQEFGLVSMLVFHPVKFDCYSFCRSRYKVMNVAYVTTCGDVFVTCQVRITHAGLRFYHLRAYRNVDKDIKCLSNDLVVVTSLSPARCG